MFIKIVDNKWIDHIDDMDKLKRGISLRGYAHENPINAYKREGLDMFEEMTNGIREGTVDFVLQARIRKEQPVERKETVKITSTSGSSDGTVKKEPKKADKKPGRNDPCPCGSGKKYKKCCGMNE